MGMAVPLAMSKNNPFGWRSMFRIVALFGIGVLLNLTSRKFTFNHCNIFAYYSSSYGDFAKIKSLLWGIGHLTLYY